RWGPVILGRMAVIHVGVVLVGVLGMGGGLFPLLDLGNFLPVLTEGWGAVVRAAIRPTSLFGHVILLAFFLPLLQTPDPNENAQGYFRRGLRVGMVGMGFSWFCFFLLLIS